MLFGREVGLGSGNIVLDGTERPPPQKKRGHSPQFSAHVYCGQTAGCISNTTCYGDRPWPRRHCARSYRWRPRSPPKRGTATNFRPMSIVAKRSLISVTAELLLASALCCVATHIAYCLQNELSSRRDGRPWPQ